MKKRKFPVVGLLISQVAVVAVAGLAWSKMTNETRQQLEAAVTQEPVIPSVEITREKPLMIQPLYDDAEVVSDEELAAVLRRVRPRFKANELSPNHVEHALRTWRMDATFEDPEIMSGEEMVDFLTNHGKYLASWGRETEPILMDRPEGVAIRWGSVKGASVHHDHWLACLTEAGVPLNHRVYTPARTDRTIHDTVQEALRDMRLDEVETEWTTMAFAYWLPPTKSWRQNDGREVTFDMLARRLIRGHKRFGVCAGTHRVYSMMSLIRLDDEFDILSDDVRDEVWAYLENVRDLIKVLQFEDGMWPGNWQAGKSAVTDPIAEPVYKKVIATGHHLEWLAIAPKELHPPKEQILKAADWIIDNVTSKTEEEIRGSYTFYSHVGNALALWRSTRAPDAWRKWRKTHPFDPAENKTEDKDETASKKDAELKADGKADAEAKAADSPKTSK